MGLGEMGWDGMGLGCLGEAKEMVEEEVESFDEAVEILVEDFRQVAGDYCSMFYDIHGREYM